MNAPVPAECALRNASALSRSGAPGVASPPLFITSLLSRTDRFGPARIGTIAGCGVFIRMTTVWESGAWISSTALSRKKLAALRLRTRSNDHFTSADVSELPLANLTFGRNANVTVKPSAEVFQLVAREGLGVFKSSPLKV